MRKVGWKIKLDVGCILLAVASLFVLLSPISVLAQEMKVGLYLRLAAGGYNSEVMPGESKTFFVEVVNGGTRAVSNIRLTADASRDWVVNFKPQSIDSLSVGSVQTVEVMITLPENASKGNYDVIVIADSSDGRRAMSIYVWVKKGTTLWLWVGAMLGVVVVAAFVLIFRRFGRD